MEIKLMTKSGRDYKNFQIPDFNKDKKKMLKNCEDAMAQAEYEASCLL